MPQELKLSDRELKVLQAAADGLSYKRTADAVDKTLVFVHESARSAKRKLEAENITHAVAIALRRGLID